MWNPKAGQVKISQINPQKENMGTKSYKQTKIKTIGCKPDQSKRKSIIIYNTMHEVLTPRVAVVSYHQGHSIFAAESRGRHCTAETVSAAVYKTDISQWGKADPDLNLTNGNQLYRHITSEMSTSEIGYFYLFRIFQSLTIIIICQKTPECSHSL